MAGQACTPKSKTYTWTQKGEMNTSIKGKGNKEKGGLGPPRRREDPCKREKMKDTRLLGYCPRT